jgi:cysteine synthase
MGASSALNVVAAEMMAKELGAGNTIVTILCGNNFILRCTNEIDGAYRYQTRLFSKTWLETKGLRSAIPDHLQKYAVLD